MGPESVLPKTRPRTKLARFDPPPGDKSNMNKLFRASIWVLLAIAAAGAFARLALTHGETISAAWLLTAAVCSYAIAYRFHSKLIASKIFALDAARPT